MICSAESEDGQPATPPPERATPDETGEDRGTTPPTPVALLANGHAPAACEPLPPDTSQSTPMFPSEEREEGNISIGRVSAISTEEGTEVDHPLPALSPPGSVAWQEPVPQITTTLAQVCCCCCCLLFTVV